MKTLTAIALLALATACGADPARGPDTDVPARTDGGTALSGTDAGTVDAGTPPGPTKEVTVTIPTFKRLEEGHFGCGRTREPFDPMTNPDGLAYWVQYVEATPEHPATDVDLTCEWFSPYASWQGTLIVHFTTKMPGH